MATDHFEKHNAKSGKSYWNFNVLFSDQPQVAQMTERYTNAITHPGLYPPIPSKWLHSTILALGLTTDYTEQEMQEVVALLEPKLAALQLPEFFFDSWWLWGGVVLHINPEDQFTKIYNEVETALEAIAGSERTTKTPHGGFIAHMSLAYTRTHHQEKEIHDQLLANPVEPVSFKATNLSLIKQYPVGGHYEWEIVKNIPIGQQA